MRWLIFTLLFLANTTTPLAQTVDQTVLNEIKRKAKASHSDALIILQNNDVVYRDFFGKEEKPVYIASAGKSLASLAIGKLLDDGQLDSLDQPVQTRHKKTNHNPNAFEPYLRLTESPQRQH